MQKVMRIVSIDVTSPEADGWGGDLRGYGYECLGLLLGRNPEMVVEKDWRILKKFVWEVAR